MSGTYVVATAVLCSSCVIGDYGGKSYGRTTYAVVGNERPVVVGAQYTIEAEGTEDLEVHARARAVCRSAVFGDRVGTRSYFRDQRSTFDALQLTFGGIAGLTGLVLLMAGIGDSTTVDPVTGGAVFAAGTYLAGLAYYRVTVNPSTQSGNDEASRQPGASEWRGDPQLCASGAGVALTPRTLRVLVTFPQGSYERVETTDASGNLRLEQFMRDASRVAAECGDGTLTITDESDGRRTAWGTPTDPHQQRFGASPIERPISGAGSQALVSLATGLRVIAERCHATRADSCAAKIDNELLAGCEDSCARLVDATDCVIAARTCKDALEDDESSYPCTEAYEQCLDATGVEQADLETCAKNCAASIRKEECQ
jgi:hypothetical protein